MAAWITNSTEHGFKHNNVCVGVFEYKMRNSGGCHATLYLDNGIARAPHEHKHTRTCSYTQQKGSNGK